MFWLEAANYHVKNPPPKKPQCITELCRWKLRNGCNNLLGVMKQDIRVSVGSDLTLDWPCTWQHSKMLKTANSKPRSALVSSIHCSFSRVLHDLLLVVDICTPTHPGAVFAVRAQSLPCTDIEEQRQFDISTSWIGWELSPFSGFVWLNKTVLYWQHK